MVALKIIIGKCIYYRKLGNIDGINVWEALSKDEKTDRNEILHNIDDIYGNSALTINNWKVLKGKKNN